MRNRWTALGLALALLLTTLPWVPARAQSSDPAAHDGYIVKLRSDVAVPLADTEDAESLGLGMYHVDDPHVFPGNAVEFVEPNYFCQLFDATLVNDIYYTARYQWNLDFIDIGPLWALQDANGEALTGQGVTVAVVDTGLNHHNDFAPQRLLPGKNFVSDTDDTSDIQFHGTFVSGIIAAQANNSIGIAGVAPEANILPCAVAKVAGNMLNITYANVISAIEWATDQGAQVINLSLGFHEASAALQEAVDYAVGRGVIVVAAVGNDANATLNYPAACNGAIGVGAIGEVKDLDKEDYTLVDPGSWAQYSNYNESVDVTAPGTQIYGPVVYSSGLHDYEASHGTSFAAPCVSALAALAKQYDPAITAGEFLNLLALTADDQGAPGRDDYYGYGSVNAANMAAALPRRNITYILNGGEFPEAPEVSKTPDDAELTEPTEVPDDPAEATEVPRDFRVYQAQGVTLPIPVREGFIFGGWYQSADFTTPVETVLVLPALMDDQVYYAQWLSEGVLAGPTDDPAEDPTDDPAEGPVESPSEDAPSEVPAATATSTPEATATPTPTATATPTPEATATPTPTAAATVTPTPSAEASQTSMPSAAPTEEPPEASSPSEAPAEEPSEAPAPSEASAETSSPTPTPGSSSGSSSSSNVRPVRPSSSGSSGSDYQPRPSAAATLAPTTSESGGEGGFLLTLERGQALTDAQRQSIATANTTSAVTISVGSTLHVSIPAKSLAPGADLSQRLADASRAKAGDVVFRIDAQGNRHTVPLSLVSLGKAAYVAGAEGRYEIGPNDVSFDDIATHWARDAIAFSSSRELTQGMSQGVFAPDESANRAMALTLLARLEDTTLPTSAGDQPWYQSAVNWAVSRGLSDGQRPQDPIRRQELVTLLWRWSGQPEAGTLTGFTDIWDISPYARTSMAWAVENGLINGRPDASLDPQTPVTRAETAVILQRFITRLVEQQTGTGQ